MSALDDLIDAVEAGEWTNSGDGTDSWLLIYDSPVRQHFTLIKQAWIANDMNAALSLFEALLPGWTLNSLHQQRHLDNGMPPNGEWDCMLFTAIPGKFDHTAAISDTPARALLLATLRGYRTLKGNEG